jgi:hypothetical protein
MNQPSCSINLGNAQKRKRLILGIVLFSAAGFLSVYFTYAETPAWIRSLLFFPYFVAMLGFLQAKQRTCVVFAYKNVKDLGEGMQPVGDAESSKFLKIRAQKIVVQSFFIAFLLTAATLLIH